MFADPVRVKNLFLAAVELPAPDRPAFLAAECGGEPGLPAAVNRLLDAHEAPDARLDPWPAGQPAETPGLVLAGRYELTEPIGAGGMGAVWMARQTEPVRRHVAVKLVKAGMDSKAVLARFEAERQALAMMEHPNIARVLDAGAAPDGRPFFAMELVRGVPVTEYCDRQRLALRERLRVFVDVCRAVQHAHHKGVIHRDLKPSNVLVAEVDGRPVPKVIDFGIAKAAAPFPTGATLTGCGTLLGTPEYMSPEQAAQDSTDIDTRSDVYSLGVLLYELLTGTTPVDRKALAAAPLLDVLRAVRESEAPRPSVRLATLDALPRVAAARRTEPAALARLVRGELDWVVMRALERDRGRRYETADALAADVLRYLNGEPVQAAPPSAGYRLQKFARRHRALLSTAAAVTGLLAAGAGAATWQAVRATRAEAAEAGHRRTAEENERIARAAAAAQQAAREAAQDDRAKAEAAARAAAEALERERFTSYIYRLALAQREWSAGDVTRARQLLDECPENLRGWEWRYVRRLCNTEQVTFRGHAGEATAVAFSPDGRRIASVAAAGVRVWDAGTGKELVSVPGAGSVAAAFSPDGKRLAVARHANATVHDATTGKELLRIDPHDQPPARFPFPARLLAVAFSPDGKRVATAGSAARVGGPHGYPGGAVKVWDAESGKALHHFDDIPAVANGVAFSPDGKHIAASHFGAGGELPIAGEVRVWEAEGGKLLHTLRGYEPAKVVAGRDGYHVTGVAFSPDGKRIASAGSDGAVRVWELPGGEPVQTLQGSAKWLRGVAFGPGGRVATAGGDRVVRVWDATTGKETNTLIGHPRAVGAVAFSPDGTRIASAGGDARVWDPSAGQEARVLLRGPNAVGIDGVAFSPDGKLVASVNISEVKFYEAATGREQRPAAPIRPSGMSTAGRVVFSPDGTTVATTGVNGVKLWNVVTGAEVRLLPDHPEIAQPPYTITTGVAFSPDGKRVATTGRNLLTVWEAATGKVLHKIEYHGTRLVGASVVFSPDGKRIATALRGQPRIPAEVKVWDGETGKELLRVAGGGHGLEFSPDGARIASGNTDGTVTVWDAVKGIVVLTLKGHTAAVTDLSYSPDGKRIATGSADETVKVWDAAGGKELLTLRGHGAKVVSVRFSPDGHCLASASAEKPTQVRLWDARPITP